MNRSLWRVFLILVVAGLGTGLGTIGPEELSPSEAFAADDVPATESTAVEPYAPPTLREPGAWTAIVVPDPQTYNKFGRNQGIFDLMTAWIAEQREKLNVQMVLVTGDLVEQNGVTEVKKPKEHNQTSAQQWAAARRSLERLGETIPCIVCSGNHDYGIVSAENRESQLNTYFPTDWSPLLASRLVECGDNAFGEKTLENAAYRFDDLPGWSKTLVITLEFAPSDRSLAWAASVAARPEFADYKIWILTHSYLESTGKRIQKEGYEVADANYGEAIWNKLIQPTDQIRFVVCGHIASPDSWAGSVHFSEDTNAAGHPVAQMLFDTQAIGGGWHGNGGDGWLRILEFSPDGHTVHATTFSPLFGISPTTQSKAWNREPLNEFQFELDQTP